MTRAVIAEARAFERWQDYQDALKRAIAPLTEEQLQRRLIPNLLTPGEIAEHIVFGRALWLHRTLGEGAVLLSDIVDNSSTLFGTRCTPVVVLHASFSHQSAH